MITVICNLKTKEKTIINHGPQPGDLSEREVLELAADLFLALYGDELRRVQHENLLRSQNATV